MKIAIVAHNMRVAGGLSVGKNVIAALARVAPEHEYLLVMPDQLGYEQIPKPPHATCLYRRSRAGKAGQLWYDLWELPRRVRRWRPDIILALGSFGFRKPGAKQAIRFAQGQLVYDPAEQPQKLWEVTPQHQWVRRRLRRALLATDLVFCQTKTSAERFRRFFDYEGTIAIMPNAFSGFISTAEDAGRPEVFDRLKGRFVLFCLAKYYRHKNLESLIEVFRKYGRELSNVAVLFTVASDDSGLAVEFLESLKAPGLRDHLINVGSVAQEDLAGYFRYSDGVILPTVLECFSSTYVEAMQFGQPILTSDLDFAREICGPAALYFDPYDVESILSTILAFKGMSMKRRSALVEAGGRQYEKFARDWDSIVSEAMGHLRQLV